MKIKTVQNDKPDVQITLTWDEAAILSDVIFMVSWDQQSDTVKELLEAMHEILPRQDQYSLDKVRPILFDMADNTTW